MTGKATHPSEPGSAQLERLADKVAVQRMVKAMLAGSGLTVRVLKNGLVIFNPRDRDKGRVYIEFKTGHVTWERTVQDHWGLLQGYEDDNQTARRASTQTRSSARSAAATPDNQPPTQPGPRRKNS